VVINKTKSSYVVKIKLNDDSEIKASGKTKDEAIRRAIISMVKKINSLEKEVKSMYKFQSYVRQVITGTGGC